MNKESLGKYSNKKFQKQDYFDADDDEDYSLFPVHRSAPSHTNLTPQDDDEIDPLDAFMAQNNQQILVEKTQDHPGSRQLPEIVSGQDDEIDDYPIEAYPENLNEVAIEYDSDGNPKRNHREKSKIEPLAQVDHSQISYPSFRKSFYSPSQSINEMTESEVQEYKNDLEINASGSNVPRPIRSFLDAGFPAPLLREIVKYGFESPTPIQAQALPIALSGRDLIGLAQTGSGKTFSFIWPMIIHILDQPQMKVGDGPIGIILAPTRELAVQIHNEAKKFTKVFDIRICAIYGGEGKWQMAQALKEAPEIVIATPGRFMDLLSSNATNLRRCTMAVLDEADRMFEMGFEYQMRSIVNNIRPDRQMLMFSATMKKKVEHFAREIIRNPVRVVIGSIGHANPDIQQIVDIVPDEKDKWAWLACRLNECVTAGKVLIFVNARVDVESLASEVIRYFSLRQTPIGVEFIHGDKNQSERLEIIRKFKSGECSILVATDVASRGLDVKDIRTVINYQVPKDIDTHVHRIGRTGRMGVDGVVPGVAYTLITSKSPQDRSFTVSLVKSLQDSGQENSVTPQLLALAQSDPQWRLMISRNETTGRQARRTSGFQEKGLGLGLTTSQAMTSSMLANQTPFQGEGTFGGGVQRAFSKIMRDNLTSTTEPKPEVKKRKSRFSNAVEEPTSTQLPQTVQSNYIQPPPQPTLPGFVRSSADTLSMSMTNSSYSSASNSAKKSRWG